MDALCIHTFFGIAKTQCFLKNLYIHIWRSIQHEMFSFMPRLTCNVWSNLKGNWSSFQYFYWIKWFVSTDIVLTYLILFRPHVVPRSGNKLLHAYLISVRLEMSSFLEFFIIYWWMVLLQVTFGLSLRLLNSTFYFVVCLWSLYSGILSTCPYHLHRISFILSMIDLCPVLLLISTSLMYYGGLKLVPLRFKILVILQSVHKVKWNL